jgi:peptide methionine sulfoxide reductase MsrA
VPAKELIKTMEILRVQSKTPDKVKEIIELIFSIMDPRDQNYRYGDCHCASCQFFSNPTQENLEKALKELERLKKKKKNQKSDEPIIGPEIRA